jgi:outer membrane protein OmpA-like peptidoglycan-associated protein
MEIIMKNHLIPTALLVATTLAGCSSIPENNPSLNEARNDYNAAQSNSQVVHLAPSELKQARDALDKANEASTKAEDTAVITHLAYLAKQRSAIAQETAKQKSAEATLASAESERSQIRLKARTADADQSKMDAESSQRMTEAAQLQTAISQHQALTSQQQLNASQQKSDDFSQKNAELEAQLAALNAKKTDRGIVITIGDVLFDTNKANVKSSGTPNLKKVGEFLKKYPDRTARVEGYTDSTGSAEYNQELSDRRAEAVRSTLVSMGISADRITSEGFGQDSPVGDNQTASGRQMNRRVEIVLPNDDSDSPGTE